MKLGQHAAPEGDSRRNGSACGGIGLGPPLRLLTAQVIDQFSGEWPVFVAIQFDVPLQIMNESLNLDVLLRQRHD